MFIKINNTLVNSNTIQSISIAKLVSHGFITISYLNYSEQVFGQEAVEILIRLCPSALEGQRLKFIKYQWSIHNIVGHPLMQVLSWLGLTSWGLKVHDATIPSPKVSIDW